jgi:hypothetical protein
VLLERQLFPEIADPRNDATVGRMQLFKRIELWILLIGLIVGLFFVLRPKNHGEDGSAELSTAVESDAPLKIHRCVLTRDYGNAQLDVEVRVRNDRADKLVLQSPNAKLLADKGREVPSFFLPFQQQPEVPAKSSQDVELRYWLDAGDLEGALKLEVNGKTVDVKSSKAFNLNTLKNTEKKTFSPSDW